MIAHFSTSMDVFPSKQRPKRFAIIGSDGREVWYLLKGHEDLRLDEGIMRFSRLINSIVRPQECFDGNVIDTMPATHSPPATGPCSGSRGRRPSGTSSRPAGCSAVDQLQPIQKMQIIERIFQEVPESDIANVFWLKAAIAEMWLKQVNAFSVSAGMTSIIGLGDRHPRSLPLDRFSPLVIHIDFGDCFERVASGRRCLRSSRSDSPG
jgi:phosphatidylinositol kinase/protein kinase (PI-3  family)